MIRDKIIFYVIAVGALWFAGAGWWSFMILGFSAAVTISTVIKNYQVAGRA